MNTVERLIKRLFDVFLAFFSVVLIIFPLIILCILATIDCKRFGLFRQVRVGYLGKPFTILKILTIRPSGKISKYGRFIRKTKLDELPQFFNVLIGSMSIVGPRPDLQEHWEKLGEEDKCLLAYKPGITAPASLIFFSEEEMLEDKKNAITYYDTEIWPQKVVINLKYFRRFSVKEDAILVVNTLWYAVFKRELFSFSRYYRIHERK